MSTTKPINYTVNALNVDGQWTALSAHDFDTTVALLKEAIATHDLWLIHEIDPRMLLQREGFSIEPARQLLFFHPRYMQQLLQLDARAVPDVPLKIVVMADASGLTILRGQDVRTCFDKYAKLEALADDLARIYSNIIATVAAPSSAEVDIAIKPPFTRQSALAKVKRAQDAWNTRDPQRVALAYTEDSQWRNRDEFFTGRPAIIEFLKRKWSKELDYKLMKELWAYDQNHISVRFEYEWRDINGQWFRSHGNEHWEFDDNGLMQRRDASINDTRIAASERRY